MRRIKRTSGILLYIYLLFLTLTESIFEFLK